MKKLTRYQSTCVIIYGCKGTPKARISQISSTNWVDFSANRPIYIFLRSPKIKKFTKLFGCFQNIY